MKVTFEKVDIEGFLSIGRASIDLQKQGMVYVVGQNNSPGNQESNGSGKSTIFEAIIYALTGSTLRGAREKEVINKYYTKGYCAVELTLVVDGVRYVITRTRNHPEYGNNLLIIRDEEDISGGKLRRSESILEQELGQLTSSLISSVIILGQGLPNKFTDLGPTARKERLEELSQSSEFVSEIKTRISVLGTEYKSRLTDNSIAGNKDEVLIETNTDLIKRRSEEIEEIQGNEVDTASLDEEISELSEKSKKVKEVLDVTKSRLDQYQNKISEYKKEVVRHESEINSNSDQIRRIEVEFSKLKSRKCPTCDQFIESPEKIEELKQGLVNSSKELESKNKELRESLSTLTPSLELLQEKYRIDSENYQKYNDQYLAIHGKISELNSQKTFNEERIKKISDEIVEYREALEEARIRLDELNKKSKEFELKVDIINFLDKKVSKEFRNYLLRGVVGYLNTKLSYYSHVLFGTDELKLILSDNQIFIEYESRHYENLSGGERQRADLSMQFSLREMLINTLGFNCNLLVIDEGFDNLDASGVESLIRVINEMTTIESVFTISHHTLSIPFDKTLQVNKGLDKISYVEEVI